MPTVKTPSRPGHSRYEVARAELRRHGAELLKQAAERRLAVCCGPTMLGTYAPDAIEAALSDLSSWAANDGYFTSSATHARAGLEWTWEWDAGEELVIWGFGRVLAIVRKTAAGQVLVIRLDNK